MPTQTTNIFNPAAPGITYAGANLKWTIANGVLVGAGVNPAVSSTFNDSKLVNKGLVNALDNIGVRFDVAKNGTVINKAAATIFGTSGVSFVGVDAKNMIVENHGLIYGSWLFGVRSADSSNFQVINTGEIFGSKYGVLFQSSSPGLKDGATIDNAGLIDSDSQGILTQSTLPLTVLNRKSGTIAGDNAAITSDQGPMSITNKGKLEGGVKSNGGADDKLVNHGKINGDVVLLFGDDTYKNKGGKADKVFGGGGNDLLDAGRSKDKFVFDTALNPLTNVDRVKDFESGKDKFLLDQTVFVGLGLGGLPGSAFEKGPEADDASDRIVYKKGKGKLFFDPDGNGADPKVLFAKLDKGQSLGTDDFTVIA